MSNLLIEQLLKPSYEHAFDFSCRTTEVRDSVLCERMLFLAGDGRSINLSLKETDPSRNV
jgi:hypothetical protein